MAVVRRILRLVELVFAPIFDAQNANQAVGMILPQFVILLLLGAAAYGFIVSFVHPVIVSLSILLMLVLLAGYRLIRDNEELLSKQAVLEVSTSKEMILGEFARRPQEMDWHRIRVHNASKTVQAKDVVVKLHSIDPNPLQLSPYPGRLGIKGGDPNTVNPGDDILFDFIRDTKRGTLNVWTVEFQGQEFAPLNIDYVATFSISAANASLIVKKFKLRQPMRRDANNYLWMDGDLEFTLLPEV
jgi:hypothetical protein